MANKRKHPFGYAVQGGEIIIEETEAFVVRKIFSIYTHGSSYKQIVSALNDQPIPYSDEKVAWNKNMVARILNNPVYMGKGKYPMIVTKDEYQAALIMKPTTGTCLERFVDFREIRHMIKCSECGSPLKLGKNRYQSARWNCTNCGNIPFGKCETKQEIIMLINSLIDAPERVEKNINRNVSAEIELRRIEDEFSCEINNTAFDEVKARQTALKLAAARYDILSSEEYETLRIKDILSNSEKMNKLDTDLLKSIASEIIVHSDGKIGLKMKNGQIIEGSEIT